MIPDLLSSAVWNRRTLLYVYTINEELHPGLFDQGIGADICLTSSSEPI